VEQKEEEVGELLRANNHRRQKELIYSLFTLLPAKEFPIRFVSFFYVHHYTTQAVACSSSFFKFFQIIFWG
jgi:hypothetical protein